MFDEGGIERFKINQDFHDARDPGPLDKCPVGLLSGRRALDFQGIEHPLLIVVQVGNRRDPSPTGPTPV